MPPFYRSLYKELSELINESPSNNDVREVYASILKKIKKKKPEVKDVGKNAYLDYRIKGTTIIGYVPDLNFLTPLGYEKPTPPPVFFNPDAIKILNKTDLEAAVYHELIHQKQIKYDLTKNPNILNPLIDKYLGLSKEEKKIFYLIRDLFENSVFRHILFEGEAQYLTRKAFPNASKMIMPYTDEEMFYKSLLSTVKYIAERANAGNYRASNLTTYKMRRYSS